MGDWTPEPWVKQGEKIVGADGTMMFLVITPSLSKPTRVGDDWRALWEKDARRLISCVNACAGLARPERLPELIEAVREMVAEPAADKPGLQQLGERLVSLRAALAAVEGERDD